MARKKKKKNSGGGGAPLWMTTYSDMVTLLLAFFVLLFSMSEIDAGKFRSIMNSFQGGTGVMQGGKNIELDIDPNPIDKELEVDIELAGLQDDLEEYVDSLGLGSSVEIVLEERGIIIRFMDKIFFDSGSAVVKEQSFEILDSVSDILNKEEFEKRKIKVEGHTDSDRILKSANFPTNWELSSARATNVLRYLVEKSDISGERISSSGYSYYRNIAPNDNPENKAKNRRVDLVILKDIFQELEP